MEKITVLIASVEKREETLKIVLDRIKEQQDWKNPKYNVSVHVVFNLYEQVPVWVLSSDYNFVWPHLNTANENAHDEVWRYIPSNGYVFCMDDDILYPLDFFDKCIAAIERHKRRAVITCHGSNVKLPAVGYIESRYTYGYADGRDRDIFNSLCGVGVCAFHTSTLRPKLSDFEFPFMRDLFFSILCAKKGVPIVNIQRPAQWLMPLQTSGTSVYEETISNTAFRALKDSIFKKRLLPQLYCKNHDGTGKYVLITDYGFDQRLIRNTLETLSQVTDPDVNIVVFTDKVKGYDFQERSYVRPSGERKVLVQYVTSGELAIGRMGSKVLTQYEFIRGLPHGSQVISADGDLHFLADPFEAFDESAIGFDIGVTTRPYKYHYPINAGVVMFNVSGDLNSFLLFLMQQVRERTWPELIAYEKKFGHDKQENPNSWYVDQDMWCVAYLNRDYQLWEDFGLVIKDIGPDYNYCPHADGPSAEEGKKQLMRAFHEDKVHVLHLKSRLKELLFEGLLQ